MKKIIIALLLISGVNIYAQTSEIVRSFDSLVINSNNWQEYRVIKKVDLESFKKELIFKSDSINTIVKNLKENIAGVEKKLDSAQKNNSSLKTELDNLKNANDEIELLGLSMPKSTYSILVWSIIIVLALAFVFMFIKYRNRNIVTQEIKENLENTTKEFEEYKHRAIEKQQKLGRELLDAQKLAQNRNTKK